MEVTSPAPLYTIKGWSGYGGMFTGVCSSFHEIFYFLEAQDLLDPDNECDLFVLHCVFLPVINHHLQAFVIAWNKHPLRILRGTGHRTNSARIFFRHCQQLI